MATIKYFTTCAGEVFRLTDVWHGGLNPRNGRYASEFRGRCPNCGFSHIADRMVEYKSWPSRHECDARCMNASGKIMKCECSCGGKNHGLGGAPRVLGRPMREVLA